MYMANIKIIGADKRRIQKIIFVTLGTKNIFGYSLGLQRIPARYVYIFVFKNIFSIFEPKHFL